MDGFSTVPCFFALFLISSHLAGRRSTPITNERYGRRVILQIMEILAGKFSLPLPVSEGRTVEKEPLKSITSKCNLQRAPGVGLLFYLFVPPETNSTERTISANYSILPYGVCENLP